MKTWLDALRFHLTNMVIPAPEHCSRTVNDVFDIGEITAVTDRIFEAVVYFEAIGIRWQKRVINPSFQAGTKSLLQILDGSWKDNFVTYLQKDHPCLFSITDSIPSQLIEGSLGARRIHTLERMLWVQAAFFQTKIEWEQKQRVASYRVPAPIPLAA